MFWSGSEDVVEFYKTPGHLITKNETFLIGSQVQTQGPVKLDVVYTAITASYLKTTQTSNQVLL